MSNKEIDKIQKRIRTLKVEKRKLMIDNENLLKENKNLLICLEELKSLKQMMSLTNVLAVNLNAFFDSLNLLRIYICLGRRECDPPIDLSQIFFVNNGQTVTSTTALSGNNLPMNLERVEETQEPAEFDNDIKDKENLTGLDNSQRLGSKNTIHRRKLRRRAKKDGGNFHKNSFQSQQKRLDKLSITCVVGEYSSGKKKGSKKSKSKAVDLVTGKPIKQNLRKDLQRV